MRVISRSKELMESMSLFFFLRFYLFIFGCAGSSLLCTGFLSLWGSGAPLVVLHGLLTAVAALVVSPRL